MDPTEFEALAQRMGMDGIAVLHGNAFSSQGKNTIVLGPVGIGKSTALRHMIRHGEATPLEESFLLVGFKGTQAYVDLNWNHARLALAIGYLFNTATHHASKDAVRKRCVHVGSHPKDG